MVNLPHQMDRCDVCGKRTRKIDLVRTNVDFMAAAGSNYIKYSSYSSSGWSYGTTVDAGAISIGPFADQSRVVIGDDNSTTESFGSQTWTGEGIVYATGDAADTRSWTSMVLSVDVGAYQQNTDHGLTIVLGSQDSSGGNKQALSTWMITGSARVWVTLTPSDLTFPNNFNAYIEVTPDTAGQKWWWDRFQLEKDATKMGAFVPTTGATVDRVDTPMMTVRKVCSSCFEKPRLRSGERNHEAEQRTEDPVAVDIQEV